MDDSNPVRRMTEGKRIAVSDVASQGSRIIVQVDDVAEPRWAGEAQGAGAGRDPA